jgi:hypothetical protein
MLQAARGWDDDAWEESLAALVERGWLHADGTPTASGATARQDIEDLTDRLAAEPWERLGDEASESLGATLAALARAIGTAGSIPVPNPIGLPAPD